MNKVTIFWNERLSDRFYWCSGETNSENIKTTPQNSSAIHELESHELLKADLSALADSVQGKRVELILSSADIHLGQVTLPNKAQRHLRKAVPYLLEEQLSESVDDVFIAIGERLKGDDIPVRVINQEYIKQIIAQFKTAEIKLDSVRVDLDLLEIPEVGFSVVMQKGLLLISEDSGQQWVCEQDNFSWLVQKRLVERSTKVSSDQQEQASELPIALPMLVITSNDDAYRLFEKSLPVGVFAPQQTQVESTFKYLSNLRRPALNLLQAEYEPKVENSPLKNILHKVASLAAIIFVVHVAYQGSKIVALEQEKSNLGKQRTALWKQAFPGKKVPSNPDKTLRTHMSTLGGGEGENSFLAILQSTSEKIKDLTTLYPTNISYEASRNELRMDVIAKDLPLLNQYRDDLKQSGHQVESTSATQRGDVYSSRLIIRK
jgi:general secretion pathway protein L